MMNTQTKKVLIVFGAIFAFCIVYSFMVGRRYEGFADEIPMKTCKADSDCPIKFKCKDGNCVYNRPLP